MRPVGVMANDGIVSPGRRLPATAQRKGSFTARPSGGLGFEPSERLFIQEPSAAKTSLAKPCLKLLGSPFQDKTPQTPDRLQRNKESKILGADTWPAAALRRTPNKQQRAEGRGLKQQRAGPPPSAPGPRLGPLVEDLTPVAASGEFGLRA